MTLYDQALALLRRIQLLADGALPPERKLRLARATVPAVRRRCDRRAGR
jgi:hypothetical protein